MRTPVFLSLFAAAAQASCPPPYSGSGHATYYVSAAGSACSIANVDGETTAITSVRWIGSAHCGECLSVQGPLGSAIVKVTDECPDCAASDLDLTQAAFAKIGNLADGIINIGWQRVDCPVAGSLKLQVQDGVNPYYFSFLADDTLQGIAAVSIKQNQSSSWESLVRLSYGYFNIGSSSGLAFPLSVQLTSQSGEVLRIADAIPNSAAGITYATSDQFTPCAGRIFASDFGSAL
jgi:expansin (peptidoglycan-binding protein)